VQGWGTFASSMFQNTNEFDEGTGNSNVRWSVGLSERGKTTLLSAQY
jgi:hypothetical protein